MIEIHEGTNGYYPHDPNDVLRFGPEDARPTYRKAWVVANEKAKPRERIYNHTSGKTPAAAH